MAALEEFLQEKYVENYDRFSSNDNNKVAKLATLYQNYFYNPQDDGYGTVNYVLDSKGHALYLVNKVGLPKEIQDTLSGGNCGVGKTGFERYKEYSSLVDVYGVTSDLKVYFSSGDGTFLGVASDDELDKDTTSRVLLESSNPLASIIKKDGTNLTVADVQSVATLKIDSSSSISSLSDLYVLTSLKELTLENKKLESLDGIETAIYLDYVYFKECEIGDYSALSKVSNLTYLYNYGIDDKELEALCSGIENANFPKLQYFASVGRNEFICNFSDVSTAASRTSSKYITNLVPIGTLKSSCIGNVKYLSLQSNEITDTLNEDGTTKYALENISLMKELLGIRVERNKITSLKGVKDMSGLVHVIAASNNLGKNESYNASVVVYDEDGEDITTDEDRGKKSDSDALADLTGKTNLETLYLLGNPDLKWVGYIVECTSLTTLYFGTGSDSVNDCLRMVGSEVAKIKDVVYGCERYTMPGKYWLSLLSTTDSELDVNIGGGNITRDQFLTLKTYANIKYLNLLEVKIYESYDDATDTYSGLISEQGAINALVTDVLKYLTHLKYLNLSSKSGCSLNNFNDLTFIKGQDVDNTSDDIDLIELCVMNTKVSTKVQSGASYIYYDNGLKLLNTRKVPNDLNSPFYCASLKVLFLNESHIDLGDIPDVVKRCCSQFTNSNYYFASSSKMGCLYTDNNTIFSTFANVSGLTSLYMSGQGVSDTAFLDLTNMTSLRTFYNNTANIKGFIKLPSSCTSIQCSHTPIDFSNFTSDITSSITFKADSKDRMIKSLSTIQPGVSLSQLQLRLSNYLAEDDTYFDIFEKVYENRNCDLVVDKITAENTANTRQNVTSLNGFQYIDGLKHLQLSAEKVKMKGINDISALSKFSDTLEYLELANMSIVDVTIIANMTRLSYLNLEGNNLVPYIEIDKLDSNGNVVMKNGVPEKEQWWTIEEICKRLKSNLPTTRSGSSVTKATLKLKNNRSISDWSAFTNDMSKFMFTTSYMSTYGNDS